MQTAEHHREQFELAYATAWAKDRDGGETPEQLAAEIKSWRIGDTYGQDLPRLRFGWEGYQWARDSKCLAQIEEPAQPVLYVSPGQLANHSNPEGPESAKAGRYLPARKTPAGKFTQPLYAGAAPVAVAPFGYVNTQTGQFFTDVEPCRRGNEGHWRTVHLQPAAVAGPAMDVTLGEDQAGLLRDMLGDREAYPEAITVRLLVGDGHSGHGLYVAQAEYQDEGAVLLASLPAPAAPALEAPAAPAPTIEGLLGEDGENQAVRTFLMLYDTELTVARMREDMELAGWPQAPEWATKPEEQGHLTKEGAQDWLRHLFALEASPLAAAPVGKATEARISAVMELVKEWSHCDLIAAESVIDALSDECSEKDRKAALLLSEKAEEAYRAIESALRTLLEAAPQAPAQEAPAAPTLVGDEQADSYLAEPGRLATLARSHPAGLVRALARAALAAAPQAPAAPVLQLPAARAGRIYVAGPMTGLPDHNFPAFNAAAAALRANGWHVENPAEHGIVEGAEWADYLHYDMGRLATCSAVHLLPGWSKSRGAALEVHVATTLGMPIFYADGAEPVGAAPAAPVVDAWLQPDDMAALQRFHETAEDDESYDIGKEAVARLCAFGCLQSHSFGRYSTTDFGDYLLDTWAGARTLPFTTAAEREARAAQAKEGGA